MTLEGEGVLQIDGQEKSSAMIYEMILDIYCWLAGCKEIGAFSEITERTVQYIDTCYRQDITLEQMAAKSHISPQHLCRVFKKHMGMRPVEYLSYRRIAEAKKMLVDTDKSITEIAELTGYAGIAYFGMVFKKMEGISASDYRKSNGMLNL